MQKNSPLSHVGYLIKELRKQRNLSQEQLATLLKTSQSAIARMEKGDQNFSLKELSKISKILGYPVLQISSNTTDDFCIEGGRVLSGEITTNVSKNGALPLVCASLLNRGTTILHGIPRIEEIARMLEVMESIGVGIEWLDHNTLKIQPPKKFDIASMNKLSASKMRSVIMLIGPLAHRLSSFDIPHSGGCKMGNRTISAHRYGLEALGITIKTKEDHYAISAKPRANVVTMYEASDTGTESILMAAAGIPKTTTIHFGQENYMVQDLMGFLRALGVRIERTSVSTMEVTGVADVNTTIEYYNSEDPIESMALITAGIMTRGSITVQRCPIDFLRLEIAKLQLMGQKFKISPEYLAENGFTRLVDITITPSRLKALDDKIHPLPYPGINVDNLPFFVPIATQAEGTTLIHDWMWENRAIYFTELNRLGADITLADPHRAFIKGPTPLSAAQIVCPPALRPSVIIFLAMLAAPGVSTLRNVYSIKRGYEDIDKRLNALGANIQQISNF